MDYFGLVVSVFSGVFSAALVFLIAKLINNVLVPWYRNIVYSGVCIGGEWHCVETNMSQEIFLVLQQKADVVTGVASYIRRSDGDVSSVRTYEPLRSFKVSGVVRDRFVQLALYSSSPERIGMVSYLFEVRGDGRNMKGVSAFYSVVSADIMSVSHDFYRDRAIAEGVAEERKAEVREMRRRYLQQEIRELDDEESGQESIDDLDVPF